MKIVNYDYSTDENAELYKFVSIGPKGKIVKLVVYTIMQEDNIYNLAFGDYNEVTDAIDDKTISNNNDSKKVLSTVASTLYDFTDTHLGVWIFATGSNNARTRLYRMGISANIENILVDFDLLGLINDNWYDFDKNIDFEAFLVKRK